MYLWLTHCPLCKHDDVLKKARDRERANTAGNGREN